MDIFDFDFFACVVLGRFRGRLRFVIFVHAIRTEFHL